MEGSKNAVPVFTCRGTPEEVVLLDELQHFLEEVGVVLSQPPVLLFLQRRQLLPSLHLTSVELIQQVPGAHKAIFGIIIIGNRLFYFRKKHI